jgi:hypothetical protein
VHFDCDNARSNPQRDRTGNVGKRRVIENFKTDWASLSTSSDETHTASDVAFYVSTIPVDSLAFPRQSRIQYGPIPSLEGVGE